MNTVATKVQFENVTPLSSILQAIKGHEPYTTKNRLRFISVYLRVGSFLGYILDIRCYDLRCYIIIFGGGFPSLSTRESSWVTITY